MFDLRSEDGSVRKKEYKSPIPADDKPARPVTGNKLDTQANHDLHQRLLDHYTRELDRQYLNRVEMAIDEDFYDNEQWAEADKATLEERGQDPIVYNVISASVDWVIGTEKRSRTDFKILPRRKDGSKPAERKSQLLKYLSDVNRTPFHVSRSFEDSAKVGLGWIEDGITDDDGQEPIYCRYESWRNMLHDSSATEMDLSDARYVFRTKWVDLDTAQAMFPKRKSLLARSVDNAYDYHAFDLFGDQAMDSREIELDQGSRGSRSDDVTGGFFRRRVRLIEAWFIQPVMTKKVSGGQFAGELYDEASAGHQEEIQRGDAEVRERLTMRMHVAIFTHAGLLYLGPSPYRHNRYPFTPIWAYRRGKDGLPYGMIRRLRDIQRDINKRASKALHILSTNKVIMEKGAVDDIDDMLEEVSRPDGVTVVNPNKRFEINNERELSQWHLELMSRSIAMIQQSSGVTDELLGRRTNATSGIAIERRQNQGSMTTTKLFDNLRYAKQISGEKQCSLIEQFMTDKKAFRITNMRGTPEYVEVNDGLPDNDIVRTKADYVISEADWRASVRQAQADELLELLGKLAPVAPAVVMVMLDLVVESMDLPNREELVNRIRAVTGARDPDAEEPTPEELQREQAKQAEGQLQQATIMAQLRKLVAEAAKTEAQAADLASKTVGSKVSAQNAALDAAHKAIAVPAAANVADHILAESGFTSKSDMEDAAAAASAQQQQAAAAQQEAAAQQQQQQQQQEQQQQPPAPRQPAPTGLGI